jgi:hypothetical protein
MSDEQGGIKDEMLRKLKENSEDPEKQRAFAQDLIRRHREAGKSMFGSHSAYPGERLEVLPDGRWFIIDKHSVRVREVEPKD